MHWLWRKVANAWTLGSLHVVPLHANQRYRFCVVLALFAASDGAGFSNGTSLRLTKIGNSSKWESLVGTQWFECSLYQAGEVCAQYLQQVPVSFHALDQEWVQDWAPLQKLGAASPARLVDGNTAIPCMVQAPTRLAATQKKLHISTVSLCASAAIVLMVTIPANFVCQDLLPNAWHVALCTVRNRQNRHLCPERAQSRFISVQPDGAHSHPIPLQGEIN